MSNTDEVRAALKAASGALTAAEIGETAGISGGDASKLLYAMVQTGEVEKQEGEGRATYIRNPSFTAKRATKPAPADGAAELIKPSRKTSRKAKPAKAARQAKAAKPARKAKPARRVAKKVVRVLASKIKAAVERTAAHQDEQPATVHTATVSISRKAVRTLLAFIMQSDRPLNAETRSAALSAMECAA